MVAAIIIITTTVIVTIVFRSSVPSGKGHRLWSQACAFGHCSRLRGVLIKFTSFLESQNGTVFGNRAIEAVIN